MATAVVLPVGGGPAPGVVPNVAAPPLPFPGDLGIISGWLLNQSLSATSSSIVWDIEAGFRDSCRAYLRTNWNPIILGL